MGIVTYWVTVNNKGRGHTRKSEKKEKERGKKEKKKIYKLQRGQERRRSGAGSRSWSVPCATRGGFRVETLTCSASCALSPSPRARSLGCVAEQVAMAFEDIAEEELDYENEDALDTGLPGHPVLNDEELDEEEDYEDLYGDVNVGMYGGQPAGQPAAAYRNAVPNGDLGYGDMDSGNEDEDVADEPKVELVEPRDAGGNSLRPGVAPAMRPQEESVDYQHEYLPQVKEENMYGDSEPGPSLGKSKDEFEPGLAPVARPPSAPKVVKSISGPNGTGGGEGGAGRGFHPGGWPAGSGPAGRGLLHSCYRFRSFPCLVHVVCILICRRALQAAIRTVEHMFCGIFEDLGFPHRVSHVSSVGIFVLGARSLVTGLSSMALIRAGVGRRQSSRSKLCNFVPYSAIEVRFFTTLFSRLWQFVSVGSFTFFDVYYRLFQW